MSIDVSSTTSLPDEEHGLLRSLQELGRRAVEETDLRVLARLATRIVKEQLRLVHVALALVDHERGVAELLAEASDLDVVLKPGDTQPLTRGVVGRAAREGRTVYVPDVSADPEYVPVTPGVASELVVPIWSRGRVTAVLNCESREPGQLAQRAAFLEVAARQLGVAIDNARLIREREEVLEEAQRRAQELEVVNEIARIATQDLELGPMLQRMADAMSRRFDWEFVACVIVEHERNWFRCEAVSSRVPTEISVGYGRELGSGVVGEVAVSGIPLLIDDVREHENYVETLPGGRSELCVPVTHGEAVVAVINLESRRVGAFRGQLPLLQTIADQMAGAIASARLYREVRHRSEHLELIGEVSRLAMESEALDVLLDRVVEFIRLRFDLPIVDIVLLDEETMEIELVAHVGELPVNIERGMRWSADSAGVVGRVVTSGEEQLVLDVRRDPDYVTINPEVLAELALPIRFNERMLGVINMESTTADVFRDENCVVIRTLVDQIAGAVHMATVNQQLSEANRMLHDLFSRHVAPDVAELLLREPDRFDNRGERRQASILFADIRGFTRLSQRLGSEEILDLLNEFHAAVGEAIFSCRGSINNLAGDGVMAVFGVPERMDDHAEAAARAGLQIQAAAVRLNPRWEKITGEPLEIVVAINTGEVVAGNIGDPRRVQFTVIGDAVNVAARLEEEAKARGVGTMVSGAVVDALGEGMRARSLGRVELRGRRGQVRIYELLGGAAD